MTLTGWRFERGSSTTTYGGKPAMEPANPASAVPCEIYAPMDEAPLRLSREHRTVAPSQWAEQTEQREGEQRAGERKGRHS